VIQQGIKDGRSELHEFIIDGFPGGKAQSVVVVFRFAGRAIVTGAASLPSLAGSGQSGFRWFAPPDGLRVRIGQLREELERLTQPVPVNFQELPQVFRRIGDRRVFPGTVGPEENTGPGDGRRLGGVEGQVADPQVEPVSGRHLGAAETYHYGLAIVFARFPSLLTGKVRRR